ncbi:cysteine hydrolase family protein [Photobacterium sp. TY1-4]|uniref:cysteine hydrolase family protein n=1 Tax=Photobacterium sp. TY1-4 TaxID=2899122 RepID=UPI0021BFC5DF|nr:cysteine hydrolase family protein [Photobacterium sp. TY1-4]UXI03558.1 cysteine hydrolase [Photobacterium sp. TY1-4]
MAQKALLVIDLQNDYFPEGQYPLWNTAQTLTNIQAVIAKAHAAEVPVILIQHVADPAKGRAPFFNADSQGVEIHSDIQDCTPNSTVVVKRFADSFEQTQLAEILAKHQVEELLICGMMTQNCVTHTAISKAAESYKVAVIEDCCTTVDEMVHKIALNALSVRVPLINSQQVF